MCLKYTCAHLGFGFGTFVIFFCVIGAGGGRGWQVGGGSFAGVKNGFKCLKTGAWGRSLSH